MTKTTRSTRSQSKATSARKTSSSSRARHKKKGDKSTSKTRPKKQAKQAVKKKPKKVAAKKAGVRTKKKVTKKKPAPQKKRKRAATRAAVKAGVPGKAKAASKAKPSKRAAGVLGHSAAIKAFGQASKLFNHHDFEKARRAFSNFIERFPDESEMVARARTYIAICQQKLSRSRSLPRDAEALYDRGVIELNKGRVLVAISCFEKALKREPQAPYILYSLAAAHARLGEVEKALAELKQAIGQREVFRVHARRDSDFIRLYRHPEFQELVGWELVEESTPPPPVEP